MSESVKMPALGESVTEGTVTRWLKAVGESVEVDEPLLEVSTDKVDTEVPSPVAGVVEKILVEEDDTVEVGAELAVIGDGSGGEPAEEEPQDEAAQTSPAASEAPASEEVEAAQPESADTEEPAQAQQEATESAPTGTSGGTGQAVQMPALGESVTEGTVTRWLKSEGDTVEVDEPLLEVSTDKVDTEVPSPVAGTVTKILVQEDETVEVGADLCYVGEAGDGAQEAPQQQEAPRQQEEQQAAPQQQEQPQEQEAPQQQEAEKGQIPEEVTSQETEDEGEQVQAGQEPERADQEQVERTFQQTAPADAVAPGRSRGDEAGGATYVTPLVRKLAAEKGVDLAQVQGTGVGGRIRKQDVLEAAEKAAPAAEPAPSAAPQPTVPEVSPLRGTTEKMSRLRKVIAKRMVESLDTSAQLTTVVEVDVSRVAALRARAKDAFQSKEGTKLTYLPFFIKAATEALKAHPKLNASIDGDQVVYHGEENIGVAVDTERGLLVPVIKGAGDLSLGGIAKRVGDLAARTRENKVKPDELSGSTFTVTNLGSNGALFDTPIINQPEVAILGVGAIVKRPMVVPDADGNETIGIRSMVYLALTYDHRLVDGADAGRYLQTVKRRLEEGAFEGELGL